MMLTVLAFMAFCVTEGWQILFRPAFCCFFIMKVKNGLPDLCVCGYLLP